MKQQRVELMLWRSHGRYRRVRARCGHGESWWRRRDEIAVARPDAQLVRHRLKKRRFLLDVNGCQAELAMRRRCNLAAEQVRHQLHPVADAQHRHAGLEHRAIAARRAILRDALGTA